MAAWDTLTTWLAEHRGQTLTMTTTTDDGEGATSAMTAVSGPLRNSEVDWAVIEPAPGRQLAFRVGDAHVLLFEGAVEDADRDGDELLIELIGGNITLSPPEEP